MNSMIIIEKTAVYHTVNGDRALFHTSKTAKIIKVILLRALCHNVNVLLSNITFINGRRYCSVSTVPLKMH